jgi:hypothetical protein
MKKNQSTLRFVMILLTGLILFGCAAPKKVEQSGFLTNPPQFEPGPKKGMDQVYIKPGLNLSSYNKVMLHEVEFFLKKDAAGKGLQASEIKELADSVHLAVSEALGTDYPMVTEPGSDVLLVRPAITDIEISNPAVTGITTIVPVGLAISLVKQATTGEATGVGGASMEVEFRDSMTNERLAAAIDTFDGSKMSGFTKLGSAKEAFEFWAKRLKVTMDKAHGKSE